MKVFSLLTIHRLEKLEILESNWFYQMLTEEVELLGITEEFLYMVWTS